MHSEDDVLYFKTCSSIDGSPQNIDTCRRNGRSSAVFSADWTFHAPTTEGQINDEYPIVEGLFDNLTAVEIHTWQAILNGASISDLAADEGVSRQAIYERIRGNSKSGGGMISRNVFVWLWWNLRQQHRTYEQY